MKAPEPRVENPYVGPRPFEERHQRRFFGRDWEADELVSLVVAHPAVLLYAQSGAGKTSLINAKLIPLLRDEEGLEVMPVARVRGEVPEEVQPEQIKNLFVFNTLMDWVESAADLTQLVDRSLSVFLEGRPRPTDEEGQATLRVIIFDQFEELFTLYPERWTEREGFFAQVADALSEDPFLRVLFVLREDYLAQLDPYVALLPERLRTGFRLERLRQEAALTAVKGPLMGTGRSFAPGVAESLVEELLKIRVETRVSETVEVPGEFVEPVQLQVVCQSLWQELPLEVTEITQLHLLAFGDVDQALLAFYERALRSAFQQAKVREGKLRDWFERDLITPMGTRGTVYRGAKSTGGVPNTAIDALESQHLIRAERRAGARWYELTHDRFIGPIQRSNEAWRAARREHWLRIGGGIAVALVLAFVGITALQAIRSGQKVTQAQATATVAVQEAGTAAARFEATATAALDSKNQATADFRAWQTAQAQATAASRNLQTIPTQASDPTAIAAVETATAAAQSLQIAEQKVVAALAELKATATAAASATAAAKELRGQLQTAGFTGRDVKIAILSTGIDDTHPDLEGRIAAKEDFVGEGIEDGYGSGTFAASLIAGNGTASGGLYKGLAPEADLYIGKVTGVGGAGKLSDVIAGIKWAVEQEVDIVLVDVGGTSGCDGSDELSQEADAAVVAGLVVVVPAGNSGPEPETVGAPGCARLPITVGAAELNTVADFSSRGPTLDGRTKPDLLFSGSGVGVQATGTQIGSVVAPGYVEVSGSSISAAHAAGAIALLLQADPDLTASEVKDLLMETAIDLGFDPNDQGAGLADIEEALAHVADRDEDGVPDGKDACPDEPGSPLTEGCPGPTPTITPSATPTAVPTPTPTAALTGRIAFTLWNGAKYDVWVANVDGSGRAMIMGQMRQPAFSPDGSKIAVNGEAPDRMNLQVASADGSNLTEVTPNLEDARPNWSPDGSRIVFDSTRYGDRRSRIYILDDVTKRTEGRVLRSAGGDTFGRDPRWLPDGRIVYGGCDYWAGNANCGLYVVPSDGSALPTQLTNDSSDMAPAAHGNKVAFMSMRDGNWEIYSINTDGSDLKRLTDNGVNDGLPTFSPDGQFIAFVSDEGGQWAIWAMNADGSGRRKLFDLNGGYGSGAEYDWTTERISWAP